MDINGHCCKQRKLISIMVGVDNENKVELNRTDMGSWTCKPVMASV